MSTDPSSVSPVPPVPPVSPVYDEPHDDYTAAFAALDPPTGEPADLVARGTLATLAGDSAEALRLFRAAADSAAPGSRELLRALAWTRLARTGGYGLWPDGCGVLTPPFS
ncbi:hypothetical protein [Streptosporangium sp. V21-05]|uniref:hypothetical protein n=1 Tax=Streptosporangium sp. V21-05 TaxID=3446115 RepID=UPI003F53A58B